MKLEENFEKFFKDSGLLLGYLGVVSFCVVAIPLWMYLHFWSLIIFAVLIINILILITHCQNVSIPFLDFLVAKEYGRIKDRMRAAKEINQIKFDLEISFFKLIYYFALRTIYSLEKKYFNFLHHAALLFRSLEDNHELLIDWECFPENKAGTEASSNILGVKHQAREDYIREHTVLFKAQKKRAWHFSAAGSLVLTAAVVIFSAMFGSQTSAATFGWIQSSWSGGASADIALHSDNKTGWNKYYSKDSGIDASAALVLKSTTTTTIYTSDEDFSANSNTNAYVAGGSVIMLKPVYAACSFNAECANNSCVGGECFNCGTDLLAYEGGPFDSNGISTTTGGYYRTVLIGTQCWLKDNLNVGTMIGIRYSSGTGDQEQKNNGILEKYCYGYSTQDDPDQMAAGEANCKVYGGLYNYPETVQYANSVSTTTVIFQPAGNHQGICPDGWHIPSSNEFTTLYTYLGGAAITGGKIKETSLKYWTTPNTGASNSSGFTAFGGGYVANAANPVFSNIRDYGIFWTNRSSSATNANRAWLSYNDDNISMGDTTKSAAVSVRCIKN